MPERQIMNRVPVPVDGLAERQLFPDRALRRSRQSCGHEETMKLFRARWLRGIFPFLLVLALLSPDPFSLVFAHRGTGEDKDDFVIGTQHFSEIFSASLRVLQIKYRVDVAIASVCPKFLGIVSSCCEQQASDAPHSSDRLANRDRGPPFASSSL